MARKAGKIYGTEREASRTSMIPPGGGSQTNNSSRNTNGAN